MKVGDIVKIRENLEVNKRYGYTYFVYGMKEYRGRQAKITCIREGYYKLDIDDGIWDWTDDMLEPIKMKVGDYVKIKEGLNYEKIPGFTKEMQKYCGKQAKITYIYENSYILDIDNGKWVWSKSMFEPISKKYEVIVEGNTVTVKDDKGNTGIAKCSPEDEFNLSTGISLAIDRLKWKPSFDETYYTICFWYKDPIDTHNWYNNSSDNNLYEKGLVFKTREEAKRVSDKMLKAIKE